MAKTMVLKAFKNRKNKQFSVPLPKKILKKNNPNMKFKESFFVELKVLDKKGKNG